MQKRRAMSSSHASDVKVSGHRNEQDFAALIGGQVNLGSHLDKKDVIDAQHRSHSVKAGTWWQIFLYGRERLATDTILRGLGNLSDLLVECVDAFPNNFGDYSRDKQAAKRKLQEPMRRLQQVLSDPRMFKAFLDKSLFDGGNADYLSFTLGNANRPRSVKKFHTFHKDDVVRSLAHDIEVLNSKARNRNQMDDQKVIFRSKQFSRNAGELEDRHDSPGHYRQMKFRLNAGLVYGILDNAITNRRALTSQLVAYGRAVGRFSPTT